MKQTGNNKNKRSHVDNHQGPIVQSRAPGPWAAARRPPAVVHQRPGQPACRRPRVDGQAGAWRGSARRGHHRQGRGVWGRRGWFANRHAARGQPQQSANTAPLCSAECRGCTPMHGDTQGTHISVGACPGVAVKGGTVTSPAAGCGLRCDMSPGGAPGCPRLHSPAQFVLFP